MLLSCYANPQPSSPKLSLAEVTGQCYRTVWAGFRDGTCKKVTGQLRGRGLFGGKRVFWGDKVDGIVLEN